MQMEYMENKLVFTPVLKNIPVLSTNMFEASFLY